MRIKVSDYRILNIENEKYFGLVLQLSCRLDFGFFVLGINLASAVYSLHSVLFRKIQHTNSVLLLFFFELNFNYLIRALCDMYCTYYIADDWYSRQQNGGVRIQSLLLLHQLQFNITKTTINLKLQRRRKQIRCQSRRIQVM